MRKIAVAVVLLLLICLAPLLSPEPETPRLPDAPDPDPVVEPPVVPETETEPPAADPAPEKDLPDVVESPDFEPVEEEGESATLSGTVTLIEEDGTERKDLDGQLRATVWKDDSGDYVTVSVQAGKWRIAVPIGRRVEFARLSLSDRDAMLDEEFRERHLVERDVEIHLRARWCSTTRLRVIDAGTREELKGVRLVWRLSWPADDRKHPGELASGRGRARTGDSPLPLPRTEFHDAGDSLTYFVHCPGYAWGRIELDPTAGGERTLRLVRGGGLVAEIRAKTLDKGAVLRVRYPPEEEPHFETPVKGRSEVAVSALPVGEVEVSLEIGDWWSDPILLAEAEGTIVAGAKERVLLEPEHLPDIEQVPLAGEVVVPPEWKLNRILVTIDLLDTPRGGQDDHIVLTGAQVRPVPDRKGVFRFDAGRVQPGRYEIGVLQVHWSTSLRLGESGSRDLRIEVPPPARVSVHVIDEDTGREAEIDRIHWNAARPQWVTGGGLESATKDPKTGRFVFRAPQGGVEIDCWGEAYSHWGQRIEVGPGLNEVEIRVRRSCGFVLKLRDGKAAVEWDWEWDLELEHLGGDGTYSGSGTERNAHRVKVTRPGTYRITFPKIEGYEAIPPREVRVEAGSFTHVTVQLQRED